MTSLRTNWVLGCLTALAAASATAANGQDGPCVPIFVHGDPGVPGLPAIAKIIAKDIFKKVGLCISWRMAAVSGAGAIDIQLDLRAQAWSSSMAFAYAMPYRDSGTQIHVFVERVLKASERMPGLAALLLGHVLAHEIGHVLQQQARHSSGGIMKAHWDPEDLKQIAHLRLRFEEEDVKLMRGYAER